MSKEIIFLIKVMQGGGAERVISLLSSAAVKNENKVSLIITHQSKKDAVFILPLGGPKGLFDPGKMQKADEA